LVVIVVLMPLMTSLR